MVSLYSQQNKKIYLAVETMPNTKDCKKVELPKIPIKDLKKYYIEL